ELLELINNDSKIKAVIIKQLKQIKEKYQKPRKTFLVFEDENRLSLDTEDEIEDYPVVTFLSKEGYYKKCTPASLRGNDVQKYKENDSLLFSQESANCAEILFFTDKAQVYKAHVYDFDELKASQLGEYVPAKLAFEPDEKVVAAYSIVDFLGDFAIFFENGKGVRIPAESYKTVTNRKKLTKAFFAGSRVIAVFKCGACKEYLLKTSSLRALLVEEEQIVQKTTRTSAGSTLFTLKKGATLESAEQYFPQIKKLAKESKYRKPSLPSAGTIFDDTICESENG
ncbi:MAG: topoisomerase IV, partial [Clostridia bacterium]